jgi:hypothetical protein
MPFIEEALRAIHALYGGMMLSSLSGRDAAEHNADVRAFIKLLVTLGTDNQQFLTALPKAALTPVRSTRSGSSK